MDAVIAGSQTAADYLEVPHIILHHGIDTETFKPILAKPGLRRELDFPEGKLSGCFGLIRPQKGVEIFIEVRMKAGAEDPLAIGIICGHTTADHKEVEADLRARVADAGFSDRIIFLGTQPSDRLPLLFAAIDI